MKTSLQSAVSDVAVLSKHKNVQRMPNKDASLNTAQVIKTTWTDCLNDALLGTQSSWLMQRLMQTYLHIQFISFWLLVMSDGICQST